LFWKLVGGVTDAIDRLGEILEISDDPLPRADDEDDSGSPSRRRMKMWSTYEDNRLLAGIYRYGINNWAPISRFVGNSRTRAQCAQRWARGLNPRICKSSWAAAEDVRLVQLVRTYGDKAWTKVSSSMGNRSDVQCRYHYYQLAKDMPQLVQMGESQFPGFGVERAPMPVRPVFHGMPMPRFSLQSQTPRLPLPQQAAAERPAARRRGSGLLAKPVFDAAAPRDGQAAAAAAPTPGQEKPFRRVSLPSILTITGLLNDPH